MPIQYLLLIAIFLFAFTAWKRFREGVIRLREFILWLAVWIVAAIVVMLPETASALAQALGVGRGADLVVYGGLATLFFLVFRIFVHLDRLESKLTELVRHDALRGIDGRAPPLGERAHDSEHADRPPV